MIEGVFFSPVLFGNSANHCKNTPRETMRQMNDRKRMLLSKRRDSARMGLMTRASIKECILEDKSLSAPREKNREQESI